MGGVKIGKAEDEEYSIIPPANIKRGPAMPYSEEEMEMFANLNMDAGQNAYGGNFTSPDPNKIQPIRSGDTLMSEPKMIANPTLQWAE